MNPPSRPPWWSDAVIYQVYLRSFADRDGDGVGDLAGLTGRLEHIRALGVDAVWVTPFYPSPGYDHGYDICDHTGVDPVFGGLGAFDGLVSAAHACGLRMLVDVVPNHTSHRHPWFTAALRQGRRGGRYRDYYLWRDPAPGGGPPNNWVSNFGGPAWTLDDASGQYYYHAYLPEQPDLNWRNPRVAAEWRAILRFWLARGVDGFRIDVAHNLLKHPEYPDNPLLRDPSEQSTPVGRVREARRLARVYDIDQDGITDIFRSWRNILPPTRAGEPPFLLGETVLDDADRVGRYLEPGCLDAAMWFGTDAVRFEAAELAAALKPCGRATAGRLGWFLSNHDRARPASRFAGTDGDHAGADRALAAAATVLLMPGPYLLYQGEELGAVDTDVPPELARDPIVVRAGEPVMGRDRARTPMPWTAAPDRGFSPDVPWLPHGPLPPSGAADQQAESPASHLSRWRSLLAVWRKHRERLPRTVGIRVDGGLLTARRGGLLAALNTGPAPARPVWARGAAVWRSLPGAAGDDAVVRPGEAAWWWLPSQDEKGRQG